ncbi:Uncharacterised protein [Mycobacterium tuberculosis]|nr:Uncharacterised protein [Mycobacterium tuberculosis]
MTAPARYRTSGVSPSWSAISAVVTSSAAAPSEICEELPAWITPSSVNAGFSPASFSTLVPRRTPSSAVTISPSSTKTGTIWSVKAPPSWAAAASSCDDAEYSSS